MSHFLFKPVMKKLPDLFHFYFFYNVGFTDLVVEMHMKIHPHGFV
jgi:hypothetical protein